VTESWSIQDYSATLVDSVSNITAASHQIYTKALGCDYSRIDTYVMKLHSYSYNQCYLVQTHTGSKRPPKDTPAMSYFTESALKIEEQVSSWGSNRTNFANKKQEVGGQ